MTRYAIITSLRPHVTAFKRLITTTPTMTNHDCAIWFIGRLSTDETFDYLQFSIAETESEDDLRTLITFQLDGIKYTLDLKEVRTHTDEPIETLMLRVIKPSLV